MKLAPKLTDYQFEPRHWPPPDKYKSPDTYLFGFDADNQPYIVRWEHQDKYEGWVATTLCENKSSKATAVPRHYTGDIVGKLLYYWTEAPLLMRKVEDIIHGANIKKFKEGNQYE